MYDKRIIKFNLLTCYRVTLQECAYWFLSIVFFFLTCRNGGISFKNKKKEIINMGNHIFPSYSYNIHLLQELLCVFSNCYSFIFIVSRFPFFCVFLRISCGYMQTAQLTNVKNKFFLFIYIQIITFSFGVTTKHLTGVIVQKTQLGTKVSTLQRHTKVKYLGTLLLFVCYVAQIELVLNKPKKKNNDMA